MAYNVELKLIYCMHACIEEFEVVFMANCYMHAHVYIQIHESLMLLQGLAHLSLYLKP